MLYSIFYAIDICMKILDYAIILYCILSWFIPRSKIMQFLEQFIAPVMMPFRGLSMWIMERTGLPLDLSPIFAVMALNVVRNLIWRLYYFIT